MNKQYLIIIVLIVVVGAGTFFAGMKYQQGKQPSRVDFQRIRQDVPGMQRSEGARIVRGEIINKDEVSITVKLPDGSSRIIFVGDSVQINKEAPGTKDDLTDGIQVFIDGSENPDGSITADSIQIGRLGSR